MAVWVRRILVCMFVVGYGFAMVLLHSEAAHADETPQPTPSSTESSVNPKSEGAPATRGDIHDLTMVIAAAGGAGAAMIAVHAIGSLGRRRG